MFYAIRIRIGPKLCRSMCLIEQAENVILITAIQPLSILIRGMIDISVFSVALTVISGRSRACRITGTGKPFPIVIIDISAYVFFKLYMTTIRCNLTILRSAV